MARPYPSPLLALLAFVAGCPGTSPSGPGPCDDDSQCPPEAPICRSTGPDEPGVCVAACRAGSCGSGEECIDDVCVTCLGGTGAVGAACACPGDCGSGICEEGRCGGECLVSGCEGDAVCEGDPAECRTCLGEGVVASGEPCGCNADCETGLECIGGFCGRPCLGDEECGADECFHSLHVSPATCATIDAACTWTGDVAPGGACVCNAECGPTAPFCVVAVVAGDVTRICSSRCGPEQLCPSGGLCCSADGRNQYCIDSSLVTPLSATCI